MKRVEDVLGKGWEHYGEGQKLHSKSIAHPPVFQDWLQEISRRNMGVDGHTHTCYDFLFGVRNPIVRHDLRLIVS